MLFGNVSYIGTFPFFVSIFCPYFAELLPMIEKKRIFAP